MNSLRTVIELYRLSGRPPFNGGGFSASIELTEESKKLVMIIFSDSFYYGSFNQIDVDGDDLTENSVLPEIGGCLTFTFLVNQGGPETFYSSIADFIKVNKLMRGEIPEEYYIVNLDYYSHEPNKPIDLIKIEKICGLIEALSKLSHFHDTKGDEGLEIYKLVFVLHSESKSTSSVIETLFSEEMLNYEEIDISLVRSLSLINPITDLHYDEKLNTFRNTLIEYISSTEAKFNEIVMHWELINNLYRNNLAVYMSAFSFQKARKEIAETEIDYADKISKITTEIANKALAIPISLAGSIAIFQLTGRIEIYITITGLFITSIIITLIIASQKKQLQRISHAKEIVFTSIETTIQKGKEKDKSELKERLIESKDELEKNAEFCRKVLDFLISIAWVPVCIGTLGLLSKFW